MTTQLETYNSALLELGQRELQSLSDPTEGRRVLDRLWGAGFVTRCLEQGVWHFATRTIEITPDTRAPAFGYSYKFTKPPDWVRTVKISTSERFDQPLNDFNDEGTAWYSDVTPMYIQYVSDHPSYGSNLSVWPESFSRYAALQLATLAAPRLLSMQASQVVLKGQQGLIALTSAALKAAKSKDAANQPPAFAPTGTWVQSRRGDLDTPKLGNKLIG